MSWYKKIPLTDPQLNYIKLVQDIFKVQDATKKWVPYKLTPHQIEWHKNDVACLGAKAKNRLVVKSRNTSFTTSALISNIMAVRDYPEQIVPFIRLNIYRANDLIKDCKQLIDNMTPVLDDDGNLFPFDPAKVNMRRIGSITFPNGAEFRAFPATATASEVIRGLRIAGSAGIIDETNYIKYYENIYIAMRDAASGSDKEGKKEFQMNIGTTLKGRTTPFKLWYDIQVKTKLDNMEMFSWPVFDPMKFQIDLPIPEQDLVPIVPWHTLKDLENKRLENKTRFLEEYMGVTVDSDDVWYPYAVVMGCVNVESYEETTPVPGDAYFMGVDIASVHDYFVITVFKKVEGKYKQVYLFYKNSITLDEGKQKVDSIIELFKPVKCRIDSDGIGMDIAQVMMKKYGHSQIDAIKNGQPVKGLKKEHTLRLGEFTHINQKSLMLNGCVEIMNDELQIIHYSMWNHDYKADRNAEYGHGDIAIANGYALLPINYKQIKGQSNMSSNKMGQLDEKYEEVEPVEAKKISVDWGEHA